MINDLIVQIDFEVCSVVSYVFGYSHVNKSDRIILAVTMKLSFPVVELKIVLLALIGATFDPRSLITTDLSFYIFIVTLILVAILSKVVGCSLPATYSLKDRDKGLRVGVGMVSRGEVGLVIAGIALTYQTIS